jgi:Rrf2 family protein
MLVSTKGRYGLRMMIDIARRQGAGRVSLREIGERQGISVKYLEQLARSLCSAGLLQGCRGQGGGYELSRPARCITAGQILRATEGSTAPVSCLAVDDAPCSRQHDCETAAFWVGLDKMIAAYVNGYTLEDLVRDSEGAHAVPGPCTPALRRS